MKNLLFIFSAFITLTACATFGDPSLSCQTAKVEGMMCEACSVAVTENLKKQDGVADVVVDVPNGIIHITTKNGQNLSQPEVQSIIERSGYKLLSLSSGC